MSSLTEIEKRYFEELLGTRTGYVLDFSGATFAEFFRNTVRVDIVAKQYVFRSSGSNLKFQGFYTVWPRAEDEKLLPTMQVNEVLDLHGIKPEQHFTQPPPRYSEASLIKELEEQGIGRPSTYVPIISTIQDRGYADQEQRRFVPTWLGETVNEMLNKHFSDIVDIWFTA